MMAGFFVVFPTFSVFLIKCLRAVKLSHELDVGENT